MEPIKEKDVNKNQEQLREEVINSFQESLNNNRRLGELLAQ
jgi:hypothetical protein